MVTSINLNGITTGSDGKVRVSGLASNIDWKAIIDAQITAKRAPAVQLETKITRNKELITAYGELKTKTASFATALDSLRAAPGSTVDVFKAKVASGTTADAPGAPGTHTPSGINSLLLTSIGATAQTGTHSIRIMETAAAQQVRSAAFSSTSATLVSQGVTAGSFTLGGKTITVSSTDTLQDLRAAINTADAGVTATVVSASPTSHYLVLTAAETGLANEMDFAGGTATSNTLGLTAAGVVQFELTQARDAELEVNGITGITRSSNSIDDVLTGVTLNLLQAEEDTLITLKIEPDLNTIKTALGDFVAAYNEMRTYYAEQRTAADRNDDGTIDDNELGPLAYDQRLRDIVSKMSELVASSMDDNTDGYRSLSQIGISIEKDFTLKVDDATLDSRLLADVDSVRGLFGFTSSVNDSRVTVLGRTADTVSGTYYLNIAGTNGSANVLSANLKTSAGAGTGGADDGSASVSGVRVTGLTGNSKGLDLAFIGAASLGAVNDMQITVTRGIADQFFDYFDDMSEASTGNIDTEVAALLIQNDDYDERVTVIDDRLAVTRATLEGKFTRMESALAQLETLRNTIQSYIDAGNSSS